MPLKILFDEPKGAEIGPPELLNHNLSQYFPELLRIESTRELSASPIIEKIRADATRILNSVVVGSSSNDASSGKTAISAAAWNIERGIVFDGIKNALTGDPRLADKDVYLVTELDHGMARSGNRFVAGEIAAALDLNYAFAPVYIALQKGSGVESEVAGENTKSIHGLAMFSKYPMRNIHAIPLPNGKDKMWG
ncbi:MAG: hypothetical protein IT171_07720, partial [Acidobacteria bacterium]|nr:hypothetical protein [Acidobacteriota bacterium]